MSTYFFPQLNDEKRFETLVADIYRCQFPNADVDEYGRRGQKQYGIDITVQTDSFLWCVQCKNQRIMTTADIDELMQKCTYYSINLFSKLIIATAALNDTAIVDHLIRLRPQYPFNIEYLPWDKICDYIEQYPQIISKYYALIIDPLKTGFANIIVKYGIEAFMQIDPLIEGMDLEWADKMDACVAELQELLNQYPLRKAEILYQKIYELMQTINSYNYNLSIYLFWDIEQKRCVYLPPIDGIDRDYKKKERAVLDHRRYISGLIYEIATGQSVMEKERDEQSYI